MPDVTDDDLRRVSALLAPDEPVLWAQSPTVRRGCVAVPALLMVFALVWTFLALLFLSRADGSFGWQSLVFVAGGVTLFLVGAGTLVFSQSETRAGRRTVHLITPRRALTVRSSGRGMSVVEVQPSGLATLQVRTFADGTGTLDFVPQTNADGVIRVDRRSVPAFVGVGRPREAYELLRRLADGPLPPALVESLLEGNEPDGSDERLPDESTEFASDASSRPTLRSRS